MRFTEEDLILGEDDSKVIYSMLLNIVEYHTIIKPNNNFDITKYINVPIMNIVELLSKRFPFLSDEDGQRRFYYAFNMLRALDFTTKEGLKYKVFKDIISDVDKILFLMDPRVLREV